MGEEHAVELRRGQAALLKPDHNLAGAEAAIDQNPAMIRRDERAIARAAAAEHGQSEHASISSGRRRVSQIGNGINTQEMRVIPWRARCGDQRAGSSKHQASSSKEAPIIKHQIRRAPLWSLVFAVSLELGAWNLELT